jgi:hypothetical protein
LINGSCKSFNDNSIDDDNENNDNEDHDNEKNGNYSNYNSNNQEKNDQNSSHIHLGILSPDIHNPNIRDPNIRNPVIRDQHSRRIPLLLDTLSVNDNPIGSTGVRALFHAFIKIYKNDKNDNNDNRDKNDIDDKNNVNNDDNNNNNTNDDNKDDNSYHDHNNNENNKNRKIDIKLGLSCDLDLSSLYDLNLFLASGVFTEKINYNNTDKNEDFHVDIKNDYDNNAGDHNENGCYHSKSCKNNSENSINMDFKFTEITGNKLITEISALHDDIR